MPVTRNRMSAGGERNMRRKISARGAPQIRHIERFDPRRQVPPNAVENPQIQHGADADPDSEKKRTTDRRRNFPGTRRSINFQASLRNPVRPADLPAAVRLPFSAAMADRTLFEKIAAREIPADIVHEDDRCIAFRDISPQAPHHLLVIPREPVPRLGLAGECHEALLGHLLLTAAQVARAEGIADSGYRIVINNGPDGGEAVPHLHVHLLGGRQMEWPPG
jgi:histidine triad (HIT) family protein